MTFSQHMPSLIASQHRKISLDSANGPFPEEASPSSSYDSQIHEFSCEKKLFERETTLSTTSTMGISDNSIAGGAVTGAVGGHSPKHFKEPQFTKITLNLIPGVDSDVIDEPKSPNTDTEPLSNETNPKNMSKAAMLRHLFFSQSPSNSGTTKSASDQQAGASSTDMGSANNVSQATASDKHV